MNECMNEWMNEMNEMKWIEMKWDEMRWNEMRWNETRWNEMRWNEMNEWMDEWMNEWRKEWMNEWTNERTNAKMNELGFELMPLKLGSRLNGNLAWTESHESNIIDLKTLCYKACTNKLPIQLCTTKLAQSTPQHYFVYLCITKLAQGTSQYNFVLRTLHKVLPSTALYFKACTRYFPIRLCSVICTTELAQRTFPYYLLCTARLAHCNLSQNIARHNVTRPPTPSNTTNSAEPLRAPSDHIRNRRNKSRPNLDARRTSWLRGVATTSPN